MTELRYLRRSLVAPVVVPVFFAVPLFVWRWAAPESVPAWLATLTVWLGFSLFLGGVPYAVLALGVLYWSRNKDAQTLLALSWLMPMLMTAVLYAVFGAAWVVVPVVLLGYTYAILVNGLRALILRYSGFST